MPECQSPECWSTVSTKRCCDTGRDVTFDHGFWQGKRKLARAQRRGREERTPVAVGAILSNHIGWADILVHMTQWLPSFVARDATAHLPFIGVTRC